LNFFKNVFFNLDKLFFSSSAFGGGTTASTDSFHNMLFSFTSQFVNQLDFNVLSLGNTAATTLFVKMSVLVGPDRLRSTFTAAHVNVDHLTRFPVIFWVDIIVEVKFNIATSFVASSGDASAIVGDSFERVLSLVTVQNWWAW